jgi:ATP-binding cassette, subfamily B, bacterial
MRPSPGHVLWRELAGQRLRLAAALGLFVVKHAPVWLLPMVVAVVINAVAADGLAGLLRFGPIGVGFLALIVLNVPLHTLHVRCLSQATRTLEVRLRTELVRKLQELSFSRSGERESGRFHAKFLRDVEAIEGMVRQVIITLLPSVVTLVYVLGVSLARDRLVSWFFLASIPVSAVLVATFRRRMEQHNHAYRVAMEDLSARVSESLHMLPVARAHALEHREVALLQDRFEAIRIKGLNLDLWNALFASSTWVSFQLFNLACLGFTAYLASHGRIPLGDIVMYQGFFNMLLNAITTLFTVYPIVMQGMEATRSVAEVLESPDLERNHGKPRVDSVRGQFVLDQVSYRYPSSDRPVLDGVSLTVEPGECVAVVGSSGSGKSTLMNLLIGLLRPTSGTIYLDGIDMNTIDLRSYREHLAVVGQRSILFRGTVRDNVGYGGRDVDEARLCEALRLSDAMGFVDRLPAGLDTMIGEGGATLSGGQQQRLVLARALVRDPRVLILDEPGTALDAESRCEIQRAVDRIVRGRTVFVVAHDFQLIRAAHRVLVFEDGGVRESGTIADLMRLDSRFAQLSRLQGWAAGDAPAAAAGPSARR